MDREGTGAKLATPGVCIVPGMRDPSQDMDRVYCHTWLSAAKRETPQAASSVGGLVWGHVSEVSQGPVPLPCRGVPFSFPGFWGDFSLHLFLEELPSWVPAWDGPWPQLLAPMSGTTPLAGLLQHSKWIIYAPRRVCPEHTLSRCLGIGRCCWQGLARA